MYTSMKQMLKQANAGGYAILAINAFNLETCKAVIEAAEEQHAPIIIDLLQEHLMHHIDFRYMADGIIKMCQDASVEVAINLDHGKNIPHVKQMLVQGMSSVMVDASMYDLQENIAVTNEIVKLAESYDASVEAEVGAMGCVNGEQWTSETMYTKPEEAISFINATDVDCLAISFGTTHGDYPKGYVPQFRFDIVRSIKESTNLPLVLHGGSGAGKENLKQAIQAGINKINIGTDIMKAQREYVRKTLSKKPDIDYPALIHGTMQAAKDEISNYLKLSGSINCSR